MNEQMYTENIIENKAQIEKGVFPVSELESMQNELLMWEQELSEAESTRAISTALYHIQYLREQIDLYKKECSCGYDLIAHD